MIRKLIFFILLSITSFSIQATIVRNNGQSETRPITQTAHETFSVGKGTFLLNGEPFTVKAAELHYPRIPRPYWEHRILMCKALGMNTICMYVFWNIHEQREGEFDFTGQNDIAEFVRLCGKHGMKVIVRPGPYVCAEWEMGGLPWWLLKKHDIRLREQDPYFMECVRAFEQEVGKQLASLTIDNGGPIIMVQVENEYGSYGTDKAYVSEIRDIVRESGFQNVTLFQCDWASNFEKNGLVDLLWTMNFGTGAKIDDQFRRLKELRPTTPLMCSEYWSGWFDKWGAKHETRPAENMVAGINEMLSKGISFSLYMTHGGTSFGRWAGANSPGFAPDVTSYDYDAPITEWGATTPKYDQLRQTLQKYSEKELPAVPKAMPVMTVPEFRFTEFIPLESGITKKFHCHDIKPMEDFDMGYGTIIYKTTLPTLQEGAAITLKEAHDYAQVFVNKDFIGKTDRMRRETTVALPQTNEGDTLTIIVEAMGRINFGRAIKDYKGITESVTISTQQSGHDLAYNLKEWDISLIPDTSFPFSELSDIQSSHGSLSSQESDFAQGRGYYRTTFTIRKPADTFLDLSTWGKGQVWVNGHALGRFWNIGPQQTLYLPGCWLKKGKNEIVVLDITGPQEPKTQGLPHPILNDLRDLKDLKDPNDLKVLNAPKELKNLLPVKVVTTNPKEESNAASLWQTIPFDTPATGRYIAIEILSTNDSKGTAAIAELYALDADGNRINREPWTVRYASSEDTAKGNNTADKVFDMQESTYWQSAAKTHAPHLLVIDFGSAQTFTAIQQLPRVETGAPSSLRSYRIYVY